MYIIGFVAFLALAGVPATVGSNCTSYYLLMRKHFDPEWDATVIDLHKDKINWEKSNIHTDVPELKKFDYNCVIDLDCTDVSRDCIAHVKPTIINGTDHRIVDSKTDGYLKTSTDINRIVFKDDFKQTTDISPIIDDDNITNTDVTTNTSTKTSTDKSVNETTSNDNTTNIIGNNLNENSTVEDIPVTTSSDKDVIVFDNEAAINATLNNSNKTTPGVLGKSGKYSHEEKKSEPVQAGKIAAGIMGAGALVAVVLMAKKFIVACSQSGVYNLPA